MVVVPPGTPHRFRNVGRGEARFLCEIRPALQFESLIETMFTLAAEGKTGSALVLHAAREWEAGNPRAAALSSMSKLTAVDMLTRVTDKALQVHGGLGYFASSPIERVYRDARAQRFEEGTNEIQKTVIARDLFAAASGGER